MFDRIKCTFQQCMVGYFFTYRLITAYLLLRVNLDKIMHARWDFDATSASTRRVSALDKHQNWSASALFCLNSRAQSKYAVVNLRPKKNMFVCTQPLTKRRVGRSDYFFFFFLITSNVNSLHKTRVKHTFAIVFVVCHMYLLSVICIVSK